MNNFVILDRECNDHDLLLVPELGQGCTGIKSDNLQKRYRLITKKAIDRRNIQEEVDG